MHAQEINSLSSLFPRRPFVSKHQAVVMATQLFHLSIADVSSVKELDSYDDRNFYMRGSLNKEPNEMATPACKEYVLKIVNHMDSNHEAGLIQTECDVMLFLQARGYKCPTPVPSIFDTPFVMSKIPICAPPDNVALATDDVGNKNERNLEYGIEIYDGEEYCEEEFSVCAVRLLTFVPGKVMNEIQLNTQLLFDAGMAMGRLDRDLKDFECTSILRHDSIWNLACVGDRVEQFLEAVDDCHHTEMVREVCESFRKTVAPKLHLFPKQVIHGDGSCANMILTTQSDNLGHDFGFIDFGDINYIHGVFDVATSLMYILNHPHEMSCGRFRMAGHFFAGYHSINPLSDEEIELLPVLIASRFCQSLVYGAFANKHVDSDNEYIMETSRKGWKNFQEFWKTPKEEMLKMWLQMNNKIGDAKDKQN